MKHQIIVDSCCDHSDEIKEKLNAQVIPLTMRLGTKEFIDDELLDLEQFMLEMGMCEEAAGSASPPPVAYQAAFEQDMTSFAVVLSSKLSGSYSSAMIGKAMAEENGFHDIHVFDSKSASAGMTLAALKLREFIELGLDRQFIAALFQ